MLRDIGNKLGDFLEADMSFKTTKTKSIAKVLVNLDPREGLFVDLKLTEK